MIPIASILIIGAVFLKVETLRDISLALVIGQSIGSYSSIFIAAPLLVQLSARRLSKKADTEFVDRFAAPVQESKARSG